MSSQSITRPMKLMVATASTLLVVGLTWSAKHQDATGLTGKRGPASHNTEPVKKAKQNKVPQATGEGKLGSGLSIKIVGKNSNGETLAGVDNATYDLVNSRFTLNGKITAVRHMAAQDFNWIFPQTYKVIAGASSGNVPELHPGQEYEVSITLDRGVEPEQPVVLHVFKVVNSEPRGTVVQFDFPARTSHDVRSPSDQSRGSIDHSAEKFVQ